MPSGAGDREGRLVPHCQRRKLRGQYRQLRANTTFIDLKVTLTEEWTDTSTSQVVSIVLPSAGQPHSDTTWELLRGRDAGPAPNLLNQCLHSGD